MNQSGKVWAAAGLALVAIAGLWLWFRRVLESASPLAGATINGADVQVSNVEAIQEIQVYEFTAPAATAEYYNANPQGRGFKLAGKIHYQPGDWYSLLPMQPTYIAVGGAAEYGIWSNAGALMVPWTALWKARTVTVGDADSHGLITPPDYARNYTP